MKLKNNILLTLTFLFGIAFSSCVDESLRMDNPVTPPEGDTPFYVKLRLKTSDETFTRASDDDWTDDSPGSGFQDGDHTEHAISKNAGNIAIFFDKEDKYISWAKLYSVNEVNEKEKEKDDEGNEFTPNTPEPEATYSCRFNGFADRQPAKVMVIVNLDPSSDAYKNITNFPGWDIKDVMKNVWEVKSHVTYKSSMDKPDYHNSSPYTIGYFVDGNTTYFTMTNSTYVTGVTGTTTTNAKIHCAQEIDESNFFMGEKVVEEEIPGGNGDETPEQIAEMTEDLAPVMVYLERMVAKFEMLPFNFDPDSYMPITAQALDVCTWENGELKYTEQKWALQILGWGLNGLESESYLFKNVPDPEASTDTDWLEHLEWNSNSEYNKRSYWAIDPHYEKSQGLYPWQFDFARDTYDPEHRSYYEYFHSYDNLDLDGGMDEFSLFYFPFMDFCPFYLNDETKKKTDFPGINYSYKLSDNNPILYTPENTFRPGITVDRSRGSRAYELAGTHLLVCARLLIDPQYGSNYRPHEGHIYRNRVGVTYLDEVSMFEDFMNAINWKLEGQTYMYYRYYPWDYDEASDLHQRQVGDNPDGYGEAIRAKVGGKYTLYYKDPEAKTDTYVELTADILYKLDKDSRYRLWRDADAINADGKIIPWIMYQGKAQDILVLEKEHSIKDENDVVIKTIYTPSKIDAEEVENNSDIKGSYSTLTEYLDAIRLSFQYSVKSATGDETWVDFKKYSDEHPGASTRDKNDIQSLFYEIWGVADDYNHGLMYYAVPIHVFDINGGYVLDTQAKNKGLDTGANPDFVNEDRLYYYYGVIRNNWYKFNIHSINELGVPVSDPAKPIVPNYINKKDQIKVEMEIGLWHIEDQTVTISN